MLVIFEGGDAANKNETTKRIVQHPSQLETRVSRYVADLPEAEALFLFNRSWCPTGPR